MKITCLFVGVLTIAACQKSPKQATLPGPQLGESTASPGANASKPAPVTPDDPRVMNISAHISPSQAQQAAQPPQPAPASQPQREQAPPNPATSSTPVQPPTDIAPATTTPDVNRPGVFSPPPPPP